MMKKYISLILLVFLFFPGLHASTEHESGKFNPMEIIFEHLGDSYEWVLLPIEGHQVMLPLPVIVKGENGEWHFFMSDKLAEGHNYRGFFIAEHEPFKGKIVEMSAQGEQVRPVDLSLTKNALSLLLATFLVIWIILSHARWHARNEFKAPVGFHGALESLILSIEHDVIKPCIGHDYKRYSGYLLSVFFLILIINFLGTIVIFPGGTNLTGNLAITIVLGLGTFFIILFSGTKYYWKEVFWPDVPMWLKAPFPLMPLIELFGFFSKPMALIIRLFANIMGGHILALSVISLIFILGSLGTMVMGITTVFSVAFAFMLNILEFLVCFIQAYVFTTLSALFIGLARVKH